MPAQANGLRVEFGTGSTGTSTGTDKFWRMASYITADAPAIVEAAGYFDLQAKRLPKNAIICAVMTADGVPVMKNYVVTVNTGTAVTIVLQKTVAG